MGAGCALVSLLLVLTACVPGQEVAPWLAGALAPSPTLTPASNHPSPACGGEDPCRSKVPGSGDEDQASAWVLVGAGDIASCGGLGDEATAALLDAIPGMVFTAGDNVYDHGTPLEFERCYAPSWGRHRARTRPAPGNHDYNTPHAVGYFAYFGEAAGPPERGYYSYDLGAWHIVVLNSNCAAVGGCGPGSPQERWLRADLAAHAAVCTLAYWHHPRFSSGPHGDTVSVQAFWQALYEAGAEIVINGHDHLYERFAPQTPDGRPDEERGIRQFTVGTGGAGLYAARRRAPNSEVVNTSTFGVLKLTLYPDRYEWEFISAGGTFTDHGGGRCH